MVKQCEKIKEKEFERISPVKYILTPKNEFVIDFGCKLSGYVEIKVKGREGDRITVNHFSSLDENGSFLTDESNDSITYILKGGKEETLKPECIQKNFRYICLEEFPVENVGDDTSFTAIAVYPDMKRRSGFVCGNELINQLYRNIIWQQKSNFCGIMDDIYVKKADEFFVGESEAFFRVASINFDIEKLFDGYLNNLFDKSQKSIELIGFIWNVYLTCGNEKILSDNFEYIKKLIDFHKDKGNENILYYIYLFVKIGKLLECDIKNYEEMLSELKEEKFYDFYKEIDSEILFSDEFLSALNEECEAVVKNSAVFEQIFKKACGITLDEEKGAGYKYIIIEPEINRNLGFVNASIDTDSGKIEVNWYINKDGVHYEIIIPEGVSALLRLKGRRVVEVESGRYIFVCKE